MSEKDESNESNKSNKKAIIIKKEVSSMQIRIKVKRVNLVKRKLMSMMLVVVMIIAEISNAMGQEIIVVDGSTKTQVDVTSNGTPLVNIATPNEKGLSHNRYKDFNVDERNLVVNNSKELLGVSKLGGEVIGNQYLMEAGREAKIVLNEVTSNKRSSLGGQIEMHGGKADFILANPNGYANKSPNNLYI
ncbi:MAG: filamentous hemagglutinin N-terminal domain-containing protein [Elusimicrobiota bacterium]|nr:filamentous hemagglutinin N-terminal domain-containing protein [Elusimicrobiota bacterium]